MVTTQRTRIEEIRVDRLEQGDLLYGQTDDGDDVFREVLKPYVPQGDCGYGYIEISDRNIRRRGILVVPELVVQRLVRS
jgi:hypothetical protein